jgi:hypothetical protein
VVVANDHDFSFQYRGVIMDAQAATSWLMPRPHSSRDPSQESCNRVGAMSCGMPGTLHRASPHQRWVCVLLR